MISNLFDWVLLIGLSLIMGAFVASTSGYLLWLSPAQKLLSFIVGFGVMSSLTSAELILKTSRWETELLLYPLPLLVTYVYFLPAIAAAMSGSEVYRRVFLINLLAGWTVIGWVAALAKALHVEAERETYDSGLVSARLAPITVVSRTQIGCVSERSTGAVCGNPGRAG